MSIRYLRLHPEEAPPTDHFGFPFRAFVIVECRSTLMWQEAVSRWLVQSGCLYLIAWGQDCSAWHDAVDIANLEAFDFNEIPDDKFVMTTWHNEEPLEDVFRWAKQGAIHPCITLDETVLVHLSDRNREHELRSLYASM